MTTYSLEFVPNFGIPPFTHSFQETDDKRAIATAKRTMIAMHPVYTEAILYRDVVIARLASQVEVQVKP